MSDLLNIDLDSLSQEELQNLADQLENESAKFTAYEQAVKLTLNSIYGAFGNKWFHFFNIDIAESITLQGKNAILYSEKIINKYFQEFWHKDTQAHEHFNISIKNKVVKSIKQIHLNDILDIRLGDGDVKAQILEIKKEESHGL